MEVRVGRPRGGRGGEGGRGGVWRTGGGSIVDACVGITLGQLTNLAF